jgi:2-amino-4-hydroxy-6-hydroxymethyldihydropteridine diphosphokinase
MMLPMMRVVLGLGSNLGDAQQIFTGVLDALDREGKVVAFSRLWRTRPIGPSQPDFLNAAAVVDWPTNPRRLLVRCRELEQAAGRDREREERWGPRVLDLDLLIASRVVCRGPRLQVPHPRFHERRFALEPAAELVPEWLHPMFGLTIGEMAVEARRREPDAVLDVVESGKL